MRSARRGTVSHPIRRALLGLLLGFLALGSSCTSWRQGGIGTELAATVSEIQPLHDRDHYVYVWQRLIDGKRSAEGVQVEHVTALPTSGEFEITITEDGTPAGRLRVAIDAQNLSLLEEDDLTQGIRLSYSPPLPQLIAPVLVGEQSGTARASIERIEDGSRMNEVEVSQTTRIRRAGKVESEVGTYSNGIALRTRRRLQTPAGAIELENALVLVPGIGEIRSEGSTSATLAAAHQAEETHSIITRRELACAIIAGKAIGDCRLVPERIARMRADAE